MCVAGVFVTITAGSGFAGAGTPPGGVTALAGTRAAGVRPTVGSGWVSADIGMIGLGTAPLGDPNGCELNGGSFVIAGMPIEGVSVLGRIGIPALGVGCFGGGGIVPGFGIAGIPNEGVASLSRGNGPCIDSTGTEPRAAAAPGRIGIGRDICDDAVGDEMRPLGALDAGAFGTPESAGCGPVERSPCTVAARSGRPVAGSSGTWPNGRPVRGSSTGCAPVVRPGDPDDPDDVGGGGGTAVAARGC